MKDLLSETPVDGKPNTFDDTLPAPSPHTVPEAITALAAAMLMSAWLVEVGKAGTIEDRARLVAGELEAFGYFIDEIPK